MSETAEGYDLRLTFFWDGGQLAQVNMVNLGSYERVVTVLTDGLPQVRLPPQSLTVWTS